MRGYRYTRAQVLAEPTLSFFALLAALPKLHAEEDLRALMVAGTGTNPGEKGDGFAKLMDALRVQAGQTAAGRKVAPEKQLRPGMPGVTAVEPGALAQERMAQQARAQEVEREWKRKLGRAE